MEILSNIEEEAGLAFLERIRGSRPSLHPDVPYAPGTISDVTLRQQESPEIPYLPILDKVLCQPNNVSHILLVDLSHRFNLEGVADRLGPEADFKRLHILPAFDDQAFGLIPPAIDRSLKRNHQISLVIVDSLDAFFPIQRLSAAPTIFYEHFLRQWRKEQLAPATVDKYSTVAVVLYAAELFKAKKQH